MAANPTTSMTILIMPPKYAKNWSIRLNDLEKVFSTEWAFNDKLIRGIFDVGDKIILK